MDELYYIRTKGFVDNWCWLFWGPDNKGYTCNLDKAGKYTKEEAEKICKIRPGQETMYLVNLVDNCAIRHFDGDFKRGE